MFHLFSIAYQLPLVIEHGGIDKTRNTEHSGTSRNITEHEKIKILSMQKKKKKKKKINNNNNNNNNSNKIFFVKIKNNVK